MMLKTFRGVALVEGVTTLALFLVAMPAKYLFGNPDLVPPLGLAHGVAWVAYMVVMLGVFAWLRVPVLGWVRTVLAALVPFGTFVNDAYLKRLQARAA